MAVGLMEMVEVVLNGAYRMVLPRHRADRPEWHTSEGWERARLDAMHTRIGSGDVVYYCGAELGEMPALCQMWGADLVLFEPNPKAWPAIRKVWEANNLTPPASFPGFASNVTAMRGEELVTGWPRYTQQEIVEAHGFKELYLEADNYPQVRIDDAWREFGCEPPSVISFDVEGSEWQLLRGAEETLRQHKPTLFASIHPEMLMHQWGEWSRDLRNWIISFGYRETFLDWSHEAHLVYEAV
ncbi:FkbM family methyltransferase [Mycobacterium kansasii]